MKPPNNVNKFISTGDKEAQTNCRGCGYNTTNEERKFYGQIIKDEETGEVIREYHYCTFCVENPNLVNSLWANIFRGIDWRIHCKKIQLIKINNILTTEHLDIVRRIVLLESSHWDEIHDAPYKEDENGKRIYNQYEEEWNNLHGRLRDIRNKPRHLYLEALEEFGGASDEPPCTRNLTKKQKKKLLKKLKEKLKECLV